MDFSKALRACKDGIRITRNGWNGPGQYVVYRRGYPEGIRISKDTARDTGLPEGAFRKFAPYLMLFNAQGFFVPWHPAQGDLLTDDWKLLD